MLELHASKGARAVLRGGGAGDSTSLPAAMIVMGLDRKLPQRYVAEPRVHLGSSIEIDVGTYEEDDAGFSSAGVRDNGGGVATAVWLRRVRR